jgi:hypothetical protein
MSDRLNKTSICSVVFLDIVNQSKKPVADQIKDKDLFNGFINEAIKYVAQNDRILLDTGDGAAIALLGAPEEALFVAMTIRDQIIKHDKNNNDDLYVRIGINLGPVRVVSDINGRPNIIGDGINVAERVMSFAESNQILVSRSYYEVTSRLTEEITGMFSYSGVKQDKHVREHEVYAIRSSEEEAAALPVEPVEEKEEELAEVAMTFFSRLRKNEDVPKYAIWAGSVLGVLALSAGAFMMVGKMFSPDIAEVASSPAPVNAPAPASSEPAATVATVRPAESSPALEPVVPAAPAKAAAKETAQPKPEAKPAAEAPKRKKAVKKKEPEPAPQPVEHTTVAASPEPQHTSPAQESTEPKKEEKSGWAAFRDSIKQGKQEKVCSQGERALNQCN